MAEHTEKKNHVDALPCHAGLSRPPRLSLLWTEIRAGYFAPTGFFSYLVNVLLLRERSARLRFKIFTVKFYFGSPLSYADEVSLLLALAGPCVRNCKKYGEKCETSPQKLYFNRFHKKAPNNAGLIQRQDRKHASVVAAVLVSNRKFPTQKLVLCVSELFFFYPFEFLAHS